MNIVFDILNSAAGVFVFKALGLYVSAGIVVVVVESFRGNKPDFFKTIVNWPKIVKGYAGK